MKPKGQSGEWGVGQTSGAVELISCLFIRACVLMPMFRLARVGVATRTSESVSPRQWSGSSPSCTFLGLWKIIAVVYERERPRRNTSPRPQSLEFILFSGFWFRHPEEDLSPPVSMTVVPVCSLISFKYRIYC